MEHLVKFTTAEGRDGHHYADSLDAALSFVERLRNNEEADHVRVFRLQEVPIEFKAYYKVEVRPGEAPAGESGDADEGEAAPEATAAQPAAVPGVPGEPPQEGTRRIFARG